MEIFTQRRRKLLEKMENESVLILFAGAARNRSADSKYPFVVNRNFYYLTGIEQENSILVMTKSGVGNNEYLFVEDKDELKEKWTGLRLSFDEAKQKSSIDNVMLTMIFDSKLESLVNANEFKKIYLDLERELKIDDSKTTNELKKELEEKYSLPVENIYGSIINLRMVKSEYEIAQIREAIKITEIGIQKIMSISRPGLYEYNLANAFEYSVKEQRSSLAFETIIASGKNGYILHYPNASSEIQDGDLILCDLGATSELYCGDISRTFPANGRFSQLQKEIYQIVLDCNKAVICYARPGLTLKDLQQFTIDFLATKCLDAGLIKSREEIRNYYYHGISHHLGLDTHDPDYPSRASLLAPGHVITVEPGLYFKELGIGIRVEDDVLITENGCECLSKDIIKEIDEIERAMNL